MACIYILRLGGEELQFQTKEALLKHIKDNKAYDKITSREADPGFDTGSLAAVLRQMSLGQNNFAPSKLRKYQEDLLKEFMRLEEQAQYFFDVGAPLSLTKGLGKEFENIDGIKQKLARLGIGMPEHEFRKDDNIPFDVRYLLTGDSQYKAEGENAYFHNITANNIKVVNEIDALARTMFMERTPTFQFLTDKVVSNLKEGIESSRYADLIDEYSAFTQIAAYKKWIEINDKKTSTLRNNLIYDSLTDMPTIVEIAKEAIELAPDNGFLQFILPVSSAIKMGSRKSKKKVIERDIINTIEGKTRGKVEPEIISSMMDSFLELYNGFVTDPKTGETVSTKYHAKALFDYLIVKDGLMFKNKSFIKLLPTLMFEEMSQATGMATTLMAANSMDELKRFANDLRKQEIFNKLGEPVKYFNAAETAELRTIMGQNSVLAVKQFLFKKIFGYNMDEFYHRFESIYATDVRNQFGLQLVKDSVKLEGDKAASKPEGFSYVKDETGTYIHVTMFPESFTKLPKGSDERKAMFARNINQLKEAKFNVVTLETIDSEDNKTYIQFKKYIRVKDKKVGGDAAFAMEIQEKTESTYTTYELVSVERDKKTISGANMTVSGELVPRGTKAVYRPITPVGTSLSVGVADLGPRPTKEEAAAIIKKKYGDDNDTPTSGINTGGIPTPGTGGGISSNESGKTVTVPKDAPMQGANYEGPTNSALASTLVNHSGGATGADTQWDIIGREFGVNNHRHYREPGKSGVDSSTLTSRGVKSIQSSKEDYEEGIQKATRAAQDLGRRISQQYGHYQYRNWLQVKYAEAVYAVSTILQKGQKDKKGYTAATTQVEGGTGYAVQMAINEGKPVFVFDQLKNKWFEVDYATDLFGKKIFNGFVETSTPVLTKNYAGIGTREVNQNGMRAIREVYQKTLSANKSVTPKSTSSPLGRPIEPNEEDMGTNVSSLSFGQPSAPPSFPLGKPLDYNPDTDGPLPNFTDDEVNKNPC